VQSGIGFDILATRIVQTYRLTFTSLALASSFNCDYDADKLDSCTSVLSIVNEVYLVLTRIKQVKIPAADALGIDDVMAIYQALQPTMSAGTIGAAKPALRLIDLLDEFDGLVIDGYGIINVGDVLIDGIAALLDIAATRNIPVIVLTNGASFPSERAWKKYQDWHLPIARADVISSRDALAAQEINSQTRRLDGTKIGCFGRNIESLVGDHVLSYGHDDDFWQRADEFVFLGALDWEENDQVALETAMLAHPRPLHIANPDVTAPQAGYRFSAEPGYWAARLIQASVNQGVKIDVRWYGKPYNPAFDLALSRMQTRLGCHSKQQLDSYLDAGRIAMVGDSLHTDILGGAAVGMTTVLITEHGLFKGVDASRFCQAYGLFPDWIVKTL